MNRGEGNEREEGGRPATVEEEEDAEECGRAKRSGHHFHFCLSGFKFFLTDIKVHFTFIYTLLMN